MAEPHEMPSRDARRDNPARFLRELRQLRNHAGLGHEELAARAHYPCDVIRAAEAGPSLPDLPVLSAYVRGCGGTPAEWEERWRSVTGRPASPLLTARGTGWSEAANAGARVGAASAAADGHDPERVMAALNRVADGMAAAATSAAPSQGAPVSDVPAGDPATAGGWDFGSATGEPLWESAAAPAWDPAPADASVWEPMPHAPAAWDAAAEAAAVWDPAPKVPASWDPAPPAKDADYAAARGTRPAPVPRDAPRSTVPAGTTQVPVDQASRPKRPVSTRKLVALLAVVTIIITALTVVAAVLAFSG